MNEIEKVNSNNEDYIHFGGGALFLSMLSATGVALRWGVVGFLVLFLSYEVLHAYDHDAFHQVFGDLTRASLFQYICLGLFVLWIFLTLKAFAQHWFRCYRVDDRGLHLKSGVLWKRYIVVPKNRMQHADLKQGLFENGLDLCTVVVHTAASTSPSIDIKHLEESKGRLLVEELVDYIQLRID